MKLLVIRNKETGKLLTISGDDVFWADHEAICWPESFRDTVENALKPGDEIVTLRIEPTEPCERCEFYDHLPLCPWCGRSFK